MNRIKLTNAKMAKIHGSPSKDSQKEKLMAYLNDMSRGDSTGNESYLAHSDLLLSHEDNYRYKIKLLDKTKRAAPRTEPKRSHFVSESNSPKVEKLELLNNLLTKKNHLLEQNFLKLKEENRLLKKATYLVLQNKDVSSKHWRRQFEESVANITLDSEIFPDIKNTIKRNPHRTSPQRPFSYENGTNLDPLSSDLKLKMQHLEKQNKKLTKKVGELEETLNKNHLLPHHPRTRIPTMNEYDERTNRESEDLQTVLDEAIAKIKAMEYELESFEQKNEYLQNELKNQKKMTEFNEKSYNKLQENQKKLLEENMKLQKGYQDVLKDLERIRGVNFPRDQNREY